MKHIKANSLEINESFSVAIIVSLFNRKITEELQNGAIARLKEHRLTEITLIEVPGAVEIPLIAKKLAAKGSYNAIIALGAVIRGETSHYDYVCQQVSDGCLSVGLEFNVPVIFGILTTENEEQAWDRLGGKHGHKGIEAAECALSMHSISQQI